MARRLKVLILGGSSEGSALARALAGDERFDAALSLAGRTRQPIALPVPVRIGGFGGADGLAQHLTENRIDVLLDTTHPFAVQIKENAIHAARAAGIDMLAVRRPPWQRQEDDIWTMVVDMHKAAAALGPAPKRVFLTVGRLELAPFLGAPHHHYVLRSVEPPPRTALPPKAEVITARGPFDEADERRLMRERGIEIVVTKNSGGGAAEAKLAAARALRLPVVMVERPPLPVTDSVETVDAALDWLTRHYDSTNSAERGV